jgi:myo-inositol 2-dehydrogenase/D-chiro-inositol 1-dehydrogenase
MLTPQIVSLALLCLIGRPYLVLPFQIKIMPPYQGLQGLTSLNLGGVHQQDHGDDSRIRVALLGCGMMGQEHISYIMGYSADIRIDFLCDPHEASLEKSLKVMKNFQASSSSTEHPPALVRSEEELFQHADEIDLLVIASPNYLHTDTLIRWGNYDITILVEKPVAVSQEQHDRLRELSANPDFKARIWVAMEYRFIPAIAKLLSLLPTIGDLKMVTIRENRYPFLHKIGAWNRDKMKTGDTLVEKCCHFFDLFRLITGQEVALPQVRAIAQRGLNYEDEPEIHQVPIIDSAYVFMPFQPSTEESDASYSTTSKKPRVKTMGCLELCMYAEGSRHQEEIIVTGTKGRLEAYLPENKVYSFERPSAELWTDRSEPPPSSSIRKMVYDCSNVRDVHGIEDAEIPTHGGYHYSSTAIEWYKLLAAMHTHKETGVFCSQVSLEDGLRAVEIGLRATSAIVSDETQEVDPLGHAQSMHV